MNVGIITVSDKGSKGERIDESGPALSRFVQEHFNAEIKETIIIPDEQSTIEQTLVRFADELKVDLILTTGGTGFAPRDVTPEATLRVIHKSVPGISEVIRMRSLEITHKAMLSRGISGIRSGSLIVNLPGSPKGAVECLSFVADALPHGIDILREDASECART